MVVLLDTKGRRQPNLKQRLKMATVDNNELCAVVGFSGAAFDKIKKLAVVLATQLRTKKLIQFPGKADMITALDAITELCLDFEARVQARNARLRGEDPDPIGTAVAQTTQEPTKGEPGA